MAELDTETQRAATILGVATEDVAGLRLYAEASGTSLDDLERAWGHLSQSLINQTPEARPRHPWIQLLPALEQGSSAIERWTQVAQNAGIALKKDVVAAMERAARRELASPLSPAEPEDVVKAIAFGLRFENGRRIWQADEYMAVITAKRMLEHLTLDGFVVLKQPPLGGHSTLGRGFVG
jgi:hypothetical protein